jgi:hypothetical protein
MFPAKRVLLLENKNLNITMYEASSQYSMKFSRTEEQECQVKYG